MPRLRSATTGNCPTKTSETSENVNTVTRHLRITASWRATASPAVNCRSPRSWSVRGAGGGSRTLSTAAMTNR
jgi:hypothetical protein